MINDPVWERQAPSRSAYDPLRGHAAYLANERRRHSSSRYFASRSVRTRTSRGETATRAFSIPTAVLGGGTRARTVEEGGLDEGWASPSRTGDRKGK